MRRCQTQLSKEKVEGHKRARWSASQKPTYRYNPRGRLTEAVAAPPGTCVSTSRVHVYPGPREKKSAAETIYIRTKAFVRHHQYKRFSRYATSISTAPR